MFMSFNRPFFTAPPISAVSIGFLFLRNMSNTSLQSSKNIVTADNGGDQMFRTATEDRSTENGEYPPLSASLINSEPKRKRRLRVDLGSSNLEKKLENQQLVDKESYAMSEVPARVGNKCEISDSIEQVPFDICLRKTTVQKPHKHRNKMWVPKGVANSFQVIGQVLGPGMVLLKNYLPINEQVKIVDKCRELGIGPGGFYRPGYKDGAKLRLFMMCLGLDWDPHTRAYGEVRMHDNVVTPGIPPHFSSLVANALEDSHRLIKKHNIFDVDDVLPKMSPDLCIVNFYTTNGRLGLHQDRDESEDSLLKGLPVVSMSIGDSAEFLYGNQRAVDKADSLLLESGDVLIFGGKSRHIFHGVTNILPRTAPSELLEKIGIRPGRLNLTFRKY